MKNAESVELVPLRGWSPGDEAVHVPVPVCDLPHPKYVPPPPVPRSQEIATFPPEVGKIEKQLDYAKEALGAGKLVLLTPTFAAIRGSSLLGLLWAYLKHRLNLSKK